MGRVLSRRSARFQEAEEAVRPFFRARFGERGDAGLLEYARRFDALERKSVTST